MQRETKGGATARTGHAAETGGNTITHTADHYSAHFVSGSMLSPYIILSVLLSMLSTDFYQKTARYNVPKWVTVLSLHHVEVIKKNLQSLVGCLYYKPVCGLPSQTFLITKAKDFWKFTVS